MKTRTPARAGPAGAQWLLVLADESVEVEVMITSERTFVNHEMSDSPGEPPAASLLVVRPSLVFELFEFYVCDDGIIQACFHARLNGRLFQDVRLIVPYVGEPYLYGPPPLYGLWDVPRSTRWEILRAALALRYLL